MRKFKKITLGCIIIIVLGGIFIQYQYPTPPPFPINNHTLPILIAHAGGAIDGYTYTNSAEAIELAKKNQYNFIELDFESTSDGKIAAIHDITEFNKATGFDSNPKEDPIHSDDFKNRILYESYHTLLDDSINSFFEKNNDLFLVTDKIRDLDLLDERITTNKDNMLIEVFSYSDYAKALRKGYKYPMLSMYNFKKELKFHKALILAGKVKIVVIDKDLIIQYPEAIKQIHDMGATIFAYTSNDKEFILKHGKDLITGFYTDSITNYELNH